MIRKLPLIPTLVVGLAVAIMIALGVWQIRRAGEKDALLARYRAAQNLPPISFPTGAAAQRPAAVVPACDGDVPAAGRPSAAAPDGAAPASPAMC